MDPSHFPNRAFRPFSGTNTSEQQLHSNSVRSSVTEFPTFCQPAGDSSGTGIRERSTSRARSAPPPPPRADQYQPQPPPESRVNRTWRNAADVLILLPLLIIPVLCVAIILGASKAILRPGGSKGHHYHFTPTSTFTTVAEPAHFTSLLTAALPTIAASATDIASIPAVSPAPLVPPMGLLPPLAFSSSVKTCQSTFETTCSKCAFPR
ncbi:hypothetical protein M432DRAFT_363151 [Thermoascus aurantiacus ATCC 26904]